MLFRRLRYMFTGRLIKGFFLICSLVGVVIVICLFAFGVINQRSLIEFGVNKTLQMGHETEKVINNGGEGVIKITDQGIYLDGYAPEGSHSIGSTEALEDTWDMIDNASERNQVYDEDGNRINKDDSDSSDEDKEEDKEDNKEDKDKKNKDKKNDKK